MTLPSLILACAGMFAGCGMSSSSEEEVKVLGEVGLQPGQFTKPRAVTFTDNEELVIIDRSGRIQIFNEDLEYKTEWKLPAYSNGTPTGISIDPGDGSIWIADTHYQQILNYDIAGNLINSWGEDGTGPGQMIFPTDVYPDPDGETLWITEYGLRSRVMHFTRDGEFINEWGSGEYEYTDLQRPMAVVVDDRGRIFVADAGNHRILVFNREGERTDVWGEPGNGPGELKFPYDLSLGHDGSLYVCEHGNHRISRFSSDGEFLGDWGKPGWYPGQITSPWGLAISNQDTLAIADTYNGRIQLLTDATRFFERSDTSGS